MTFLGGPVATVLTVYGIETGESYETRVLSASVATVLTVYGIETSSPPSMNSVASFSVATVLTVYGIETIVPLANTKGVRLQQYLPFTVLKPI